MPRVKRGVTARARHKKVLALAKGYRGRRGNVFRIAKQAVMRAGQYAYRDRRNKKREFRRLWIARINAAAREHGMSYSRVHERPEQGRDRVDRKVLADLAVQTSRRLRRSSRRSRPRSRLTMPGLGRVQRRRAGKSIDRKGPFVAPFRLGSPDPSS